MRELRSKTFRVTIVVPTAPPDGNAPETGHAQAADWELGLKGMVGREGVEPSTKRLRVSCSTN